MKKISLLFFLIVLAVVSWLAWGFLSGNGQEEKNFVIPSGAGVNEVSRALQEASLIKSKLVFETAVWLKRSEDKIQAGIYQLPADVSIRQLINIFIVGPDRRQGSITIVEGWARRWPQLQKALEVKSFDYGKFLALTARKSDWEKEFDFLVDAPATASLEGYLFPNTHFIDQDTTEEELVRKLLSDFGRQVDPDLRAEISRQNKTIFAVVTLASIVEREVPSEADRQLVADIFLKRLEQGIGLQSDATINFITGKGLAQPTAEDLQAESPYNTYKYRGLPPGPISNPGLDSIRAVIYPRANDYYYFLTTLEGEVIYSRTYDEHLANKRKYLK